MARRSQCSSAGDNPLHPNYLPPHYREEYRLAIDALVEEDQEGYHQFLQQADVVDFLCRLEVEYIQQGTVQVPQQETRQPELPYLDCGAEGSSDTYWPVHSDLDAPGLDLGWPEQHRFVGPTEVTTLVNPPEQNMPSIKEQARRLIKNAQQVIAVVMDMFTDVDIFADILDAAARNVAVYILLDEQNTHHFMSMVLNCRVNLESIQFLRVRTVSGITYRYRSGKTLKGQMMDRFLLTDCRAVLSGNYSYMWSFEKLHRCIAHLFLGQLVTTFDEEFRILFAQSQPLIVENVLAQMEDLSRASDAQYSSDGTPLYRDIRVPMDIPEPEDWARYSYDERTDMDRKKMPLSRHESIHRSREQGSGDMYNRYSPQLLQTEQPYEQGHSRMPLNLMESAGLKRHSYAEGAHGRQFLQQPGIPNFETQGRQFQREQQTYPRAGPETGYGGYDRLRGQGYHPGDQYSPEPGFLQDMEPPDGFDPVANYLLSTSNVELDQASDQFLPPGEAAFGLSHAKRQNTGQPYACQSSPTPLNQPDQQEFFQETNMDRKDPSVKQGLRDWRISSYLSAFEDTDDENPPLQPGMAADPFEKSPKPFQRRSSVPELSVLKIPNTREFKIPAVPRMRQVPNYLKPTAPEPSKNLPDRCIPMAAETKTTPSPSESSSTTEGDKAEGVELREPKDPLRRDESFRRKYTAAVQRNSRLRSSLIFSSQLEDFDDDLKSQPDEETVKKEEQPELPYASKVLSLRRSAREPIEWSRYIKSATFDNASTEASKDSDVADKADVKDLPKNETLKDDPGNRDVEEPSKPVEVELTKLSNSVPALNPFEAQQPPEAFLSNLPYLDMNDPDQRLMFFKQLAAKQKAAKAAAAEKSTGKASESKHTTVEKEEPARDEVSQNLADSSVKKPATTAETLSEKKTPPDGVGNTSTGTHGSKQVGLDVKDDKNKSEKQENRLGSYLNASSSSASTDSEKMEQKSSQACVSTPVSSGSHSQLPEEAKRLSPTVKDPPILLRIDENPALDSASKDSSSLSPSAKLPPSSKPPTLESNVQPPGKLPLESSTSSSPIKLSESHGTASPVGSESSSLSIPPASISSQNIQSECSSQVTPTEEPVSSQTIPSDFTCTRPSTTSKYSPLPSLHESVMSPKAAKTEPNESLCPSPMESPQTSIQASPQPNISSVPCANEPNTICNASPDSLQHTASCSHTISESSILSQRSEKPELLTSPNLPPSESSPEPAATETSYVPSPALGFDVPPKSSSSPSSAIPHKSSSSPSSAIPPKSSSSPSSGIPSKSSSSPSSASSRLKLTQTNSLSEDAQTGSSSPTSVVCLSPGSVPDGSTVSPQLEKTKTITPTNLSPSETSSLSERNPTDCKSLTPTSTESSSSSNHCLTESTPEDTPGPPEPNLENNGVHNKCEVSKESDSVSEEMDADTDNETKQESTCHGNPREKAQENNSTDTTESTSAEVVPPPSQPKQPKANQLRYHSSTASVLSSSNLRDDTKLLLGQISANSQSRMEPTKEPVTDDDKEDDKSASRGKRGVRSLNKVPSKTPQEREKLLEKLQSMRKERKVYSRFEMGP